MARTAHGASGARSAPMLGFTACPCLGSAIRDCMMLASHTPGPGGSGVLTFLLHPKPPQDHVGSTLPGFTPASPFPSPAPHPPGLLSSSKLLSLPFAASLFKSDQKILAVAHSLPEKSFNTIPRHSKPSMRSRHPPFWSYCPCVSPCLSHMGAAPTTPDASLLPHFWSR